MGKRIGPEAKVVQLFLQLPESSRSIVMDIIRSQTPTVKRVKKSKKSEQQTLTEANHATAATN